MSKDIKITSTSETSEKEEVKKESPQEEIIIEKVTEEKIEQNATDSKEVTAEDLKETAKEILRNFKGFITGDAIDEKCQEQADKHGLDKKEVKDNFIKNALKSIAKALHLTVTVIGDCVVTAVKFLNSCIDGIVTFSASILHKLINLVTLNVAAQ